MAGCVGIVGRWHDMEEIVTGLRRHCRTMHRWLGLGLGPLVLLGLTGSLDVDYREIDAA